MKTFIFGVALAMLGLGTMLQAQARPQRVRVSEKVSRIMIESRVEPLYPPEARRKHIEGSVVMQIEISKEGFVENLRVLSGDSLLATEATTAVKQWKYKPYLLNNEPVLVETQVTINFVLEGK